MDEPAARALLAELRASQARLLALRVENAPAAVAAVRAQVSRGELRLKADIKKSSAFVKKLRALSEAAAAALLRDARELNLTRYVSECVAALAEAPLRAADLPAALRVASLLHQRYEDFAPALIAALAAAFDALQGADDKPRAIKRRLLLRLLSDLFLAGVYDDVSVVAHVVQRVARREQQPKGAKARGNMSISAAPAAQLEVPLLVSFAKAAGMEFLGVRPRRFKDMEQLIGDSDEFREFERDEPALVPAPVQRECLSSFLEAYDVVCKFYLAQHATLLKLEARNEKEEVNRGEVMEQHVQELISAKMLFDKLQTSVNSLADALDRDVPELPLEKKDDESGRGGLLLWDGDGSGRAEMQMDGPFDDEDTRSFYEDLPDLLELVPAVVLGLNEQEVAELKKKRDAAKNATAESNDAEQDDAGEGVADTIAPEDDDMDGEVEDIVNSAEADAASAAVEDEAPNAGDAKPESGEDAKDAESSATANTASSTNPTSYSHQMDAFFAALEDMVNRDRCDKAAVEFCYKNSKASRNRLVRTLYMVPRTHLELLAYYARLVAILQSVLKDDIGGELVGLLVNEFNGLIKRRNQFRLESKVKNIRFLAELVKFRICPPNVGFACLKKCFADFQGHNVHVATTFLENCGRFLYCSKHTHVRTEKFLNAMMKLKSAKHLDPQLETLVENAYYMCKPPERVERTVKQYDPLYLFVLKLLYKDLNGANVNKVIKTLRKFPWQESSTTGMVLKAALKVTNGKVMHMRWVCEVIKGLSRYHDDVAILLVDDVLEGIRRGLEINDYRDHQRSLGLIKLLGELFNCGLVTTNVVMETLYLLINLSHDLSTAPQYTNGHIPEVQLAEMKRQWELVSDLRYDPRVVSDVDGPSEVFRIRLVCALIEACTNSGMSVPDGKTSGSTSNERALSKPRLGRFVVFFQRYILSKPEIPLETDFVIFDFFDTLSRTLKDNFKKLETWEDADLAAQLILAKELEEAERRLAKKQSQAAAAAAAANGGTADSSQAGAESLSQPVDEEEEDLEDDDDSEDDDDDDSDDDDEEEDGETAQAEDDDDDDDDSDDSDDDDDEEEEDEEEKLIIHDRVQKSEEDEAFEKAFKAMMQGSTDGRKLSGRVSVDKMAIPTVVKNATAPPAPAAMPFGAPGGQSGVVFRMLRRGNKGKVEARHLVVPEESSLAQHSHRQESEGKKEQNELKRLVLQNMERDDFLASTVESMVPPAFAAPRPSPSYAAPAPGTNRAGYGGGSEWNNDEFGLRRGKGYRGVK